MTTIPQRHRQTDGQTTCFDNTALRYAPGGKRVTAGFEIVKSSTTPDNNYDCAIASAIDKLMIDMNINLLNCSLPTSFLSSSLMNVTSA